MTAPGLKAWRGSWRKTDRSRAITMPIRTGWYKTFLENLSLRGNIAESCDIAGITKKVYYVARERDERFAEAADMAIDQAVSKLKTLLWQWAEQGDFPDKRALAERIVARHDPEWRNKDRLEIESRNLNVNLTAPPDPAQLAQAIRILIESGALRAEDIMPQLPSRNGHAST